MDPVATAMTGLAITEQEGELVKRRDQSQHIFVEARKDVAIDVQFYRDMRTFDTRNDHTNDILFIHINAKTLALSANRLASAAESVLVDRVIEFGKPCGNLELKLLTHFDEAIMAMRATFWTSAMAQATDYGELQRSAGKKQPNDPARSAIQIYFLCWKIPIVSSLSVLIFNREARS